MNASSAGTNARVVTGLLGGMLVSGCYERPGFPGGAGDPSAAASTGTDDATSGGDGGVGTGDADGSDGDGTTSAGEGTTAVHGESSGEAAGGEPFEAWARHREVLLTSLSGSSQYDHQVLITLPRSDGMQPDMADVRVLDAAQQELPLWIELTDPEVRVWVRVPEIPASATTVLHAYYGNPDAEAVSDPHATFLLFDDFADVESLSGWLHTWETGEPFVVEAALDWPGASGSSPSTGLTVRCGGFSFAWLGRPVTVFDGFTGQSGEIGDLSGSFGLGLGHGATSYFYDHVLLSSTPFYEDQPAELMLGPGPAEFFDPALEDPAPFTVDHVLVRRLADAEIEVEVGPEL